jgi:hypothetical protein
MCLNSFNIKSYALRKLSLVSLSAMVLEELIKSLDFIEIRNSLKLRLYFSAYRIISIRNTTESIAVTMVVTYHSFLYDEKIVRNINIPSRIVLTQKSETKIFKIHILSFYDT